LPHAKFQQAKQARGKTLCKGSGPSGKAQSIDIIAKYPVGEEYLQSNPKITKCNVGCRSVGYNYDVAHLSLLKKTKFKLIRPRGNK
jgi:hypothetical protein